MTRLSFPKEQVRILLLEGIHENADIGYVVVDIDGGAEDAQEIQAELRAVAGTLRARFLYDRR